MVWDGTRRSRDAPICEEGRDGASDDATRESRSGPDGGRRRCWGGDGGRRPRRRREETRRGRGVLSIMVVLRVDVAESRYFNPKVQSGASFLIKVDFN